MKVDKLLVCLALAAAAVPAHAVTIDFDDGTTGAVGAYYAAQGVTFSNAEFTGTFGLPGSSGSLGVIAPGTYAWGLGNAVAGSFSGTASAVSIRGIDVGNAGLRLDVFDASDALLAYYEVFGTDVGVGQFFDLAVSAAGIKSFKIYQPAYYGGGDGVILDNFGFTAGGTVPEPASWALLIAGFGLTGAMMRRRRETIVTA